MKKIVYTMATLALLVSCTNEDTPSVPQQKVPLQVQSATIMSLVNTRANWDEDNQIGILVKGANGEFPFTTPCTYRYGRYAGPGGTVDTQLPYIWTPLSTANVAYISSQNESVVAITPVQFYSRDTNHDGIIEYDSEIYHEYIDEQHPNLDYNFSGNKDVCMAKVDGVSFVDPKVTFAMKHINSIMEFRIRKSSNFVVSPGAISKVKFTGAGLYEQKRFNCRTLEWAGGEDESYKGFFEVTLSNFSINTPNFDNNTAVRIPCLVQPADLTADTGYFFTFTIDGKAYNVPFTKSMMPKIEANNRYIIDVLFEPKTVKITGVTITDWRTANLTDGTPLIPTPQPALD